MTCRAVKTTQQVINTNTFNKNNGFNFEGE